LPVIPAQAGIQVRCLAIVAMPLIRFFGRFRREHGVERRQRYRVSQTHRAWIPAYAGMTSRFRSTLSASSIKPFMNVFYTNHLQIN
jgi:hypothetical protein